MITVIEAIQSLNKDAEVTVGGFGTDDITWVGGTTPIPVAEIEAEVIRLETEFTANEYARNRATAYPSTGDQLDMIYKDMKNSTTTHADAVEVVKTKYPKG
jgi:hypothetical protein